MGHFLSFSYRLIFLFQELLVSNREKTMIKRNLPILFSCSNTPAVYFDLNVIYSYIIKTLEYTQHISIVLMLLHSTDAIHIFIKIQGKAAKTKYESIHINYRHKVLN